MIIIFKHIDITESKKIFPSLNICCPELGSSDSYNVIYIFNIINIKNRHTF